MRSKAHIKTHPIHPILIPFPIAFLIGTLLFDVLGYIQDSESFWKTGMYLEIAGIAFALIAAVPGVIDYIYTVPPKSSAKRRASFHGLINTSMVVVFGIALFYRQDPSSSPLLIIGLESLGAILLFIAGWLGGTLVYRNQIGVDLRYAYAGKWKEEYFGNVSGVVPVANFDELKVNQMKLLHINDKRIVIGRTENGYVAFNDYCTHKGGSLAGGAMMCGTVQCPWHGSQFDVNTGKVTAGPADEPISVYAVSVKEEKVFITI